MLTRMSVQEVHRFLHSLKSLMRGRNAVAMITLPPVFARSLGEDGIKQLAWSVDASLELKGFAGMPPSFNQNGVKNLND